MFEHLKVGTWACIDDRCPVRPIVHSEDDAVTLVFGDRDEFELFVSAAALQNLIQVSADALNRLTSTD